MKKVMCIGVWDLFHVGHLSVIKEASALGQLSVAVVGDAAVNFFKGKGKPVIPQRQRLEIIRNIKGVHDAHLVYNFEISDEDIECFDIIVLGGDQTHIKNTEKIPENKLYRLKRLDDGISSTAIMKKIKEL